MTSSADAKWIADLIRNEYDKAPDHYRMGDSWDDGAERIAAQIIERFGIRAQPTPTHDQIAKAVRVVLRKGIWPEYSRENDRGLDEGEYTEFVMDVLHALMEKSHD